MIDRLLISLQPWMRSVVVQAVRYLVLAVLPLAAIAAVLSIVRNGQLLSAWITSVSISLLALSFLLACSGLIIAVPVWRGILAKCGVSVSLRDDFRIYCYSALGIAIPGGVWPIVNRVSLYHRLGVSGASVARASVAETIVTGVSAVAVYIVTGLLQEQMWLVLPILLAGVVMWLVWLSAPTRMPLFARLWSSATTLLRKLDPTTGAGTKNEFFRWVLLEALVVSTGGLSLYALLAGLINAPVGTVLSIVGIWAAIAAIGNLLFWLPGTFLFRDGALVIALQGSMPLSLAIIITAFTRVWLIASLLFLAGLVWLVFDSPLRRPMP